MERALKLTLKYGRFSGVPKTVSEQMRAIHGHGNRSTEQRLRMALVRVGQSGWVTRPRSVPGTPDFYFPSDRVAVFVDGCFWHACPKCGRVPRSNHPYWSAKLAGNRRRDRRTDRQLRATGVKVLHLWEHELRNLPRSLSRIRHLLAR